MKEDKSFAVSAYKKVQIFKWLVKKHNCVVDFDYSYCWENSKKTQKIWFATPKLSRNGRDFVLTTTTENFSASVLSVMLPSKHAALSYAEVLDTLLVEVKTNESDCYLAEVGWPYHREELFLPKGTTLEELCIEFDLTWKDAFGHLFSRKPKK